MSRFPHSIRLLPGLGLCIAVTLGATALARLESALFGRAWLEALVLAILLGTAIRTAFASVGAAKAAWHPGIVFSAKTLLEVAVVLLGAAISAPALLAAGPGLLIGIAVTVMLAISASYTLGRVFGLAPRMAVLVACGNSICGNSAIAAVAPVIGADGEEVAASIAFTAVLGVVVVLLLPVLAGVLGLTSLQSGVLAGLTVYAVPQVLAATAPLGALAMQLGTLVKLVRVLMLGPVVLTLSLLAHRLREEPDEAPPHLTAGDRPAPGKMALHRLVPWFILGFLALAGARAAGLVPHALLAPIGGVADWLTVIAMAALGLSTDLASVARAGGRVSLAVTLSLVVLGGISLTLIHLLGLA